MHPRTGVNALPAAGRSENAAVKGRRCMMRHLFTRLNHSEFSKLSASSCEFILRLRVAVFVILLCAAKELTLAKLRISIVQYLNTVPLVWGFTNGALRGKHELSFTVPSQCAEALRGNAVDIAIIPAIEYQRILHDSAAGLVLLPGMSIASQHRVRSLLLVSKCPVEQARSIALDRSSRSTQALTRILCADQWRITPQFSEMEPDASAMLRAADAALLIGDPALRLSIAIEPAARRGASGELLCSGAAAGIRDAETLHVYDIVEEWRRLTSLPAVMAAWAARPAVVTAGVVEDFQSSLALGMRQIDEISRQAATELHLPEAECKRYLTENIDFTLGAENRRGLEHYFSRAAALGLIPEARPIQWAAGPAALESSGAKARS